VFVLQKPNYLASGLVTRQNASHGTPYEYDTHVPLLFLGPGIHSQKVSEPVTPAAIAAVFADYLGVPRPSMAEEAIPIALRAVPTPHKISPHPNRNPHRGRPLNSPLQVSSNRNTPAGALNCPTCFSQFQRRCPTAWNLCDVVA